MANREQQVLALVREDPMLPQQAIADRLGVTRSAVAGHIMNLTHKGLIKGRGYVVSDAPFVVAVGGANIDIHGRSNLPLLERDSNPGEVQIAAGGVARNIAENLARLGADVRLISAVGNDHNGSLLTRLSREAGIDVRSVHAFPGVSTSTYMSVLDDDGDMLLAINDMRAIEQITIDLLRDELPMLKRAALVIVDCNLPEETLAWLFASLQDVPIFADTVSAAKANRLAPWLSRIHTLKTSATEIEALSGQNARTLQELRGLAANLHEQGLQRLFVTRGAKGVFFSDGETQESRPASARPESLRNAGGAGDAFLAGLAYSWLAGLNLSHSVALAQAAAELTLSHPGTNNPALSLTLVHQTMEQQHAGD